MPDTALLIALTDEARQALGGRERVVIDRLPFRIGRESRVSGSTPRPQIQERRRHGSPPNNDLYLLDNGERRHISRTHLQIEQAIDGGLLVRDRGSACGTQVDGQQIGGMDRAGVASVREGSEIIIGTPASPYRFRLCQLDAPPDGRHPGPPETTR